LIFTRTLLADDDRAASAAVAPRAGRRQGARV